MAKIYRRIFNTKYSIYISMDTVRIEEDQELVPFHASIGAAIMISACILLVSVALRLSYGYRRRPNTKATQVLSRVHDRP